MYYMQVFFILIYLYKYHGAKRVLYNVDSGRPYFREKSKVYVDIRSSAQKSNPHDESCAVCIMDNSLNRRNPGDAV